MAGKISELAALATPAADDLIEILDVSDLSMAATGTNKKVVFSNVAGVPGPSGGINAALPHPARSRTDLHAGSTFLHLPLSVNNGSVGDAGSSFAQRPFWWPYLIDRPLKVTAIRTHCWTGEAGATIRFGLYACDVDFVPTTLIADYGTVSGAISGAKSATGSTVLSAGSFSLCVWTSNHSAVRWSKPSSVNYGGPFGENAPAGGGVQVAWRLQSETADYSAGFPASIVAALYGLQTATGTVAYLEFDNP